MRENVFIVCMLVACISASFAQTTPPANSDPQSTQQVPEPKPNTTTSPEQEKEKEIERKEQSQRMVGVIPNFGVTSRLDAPPLKPGEKFRLFAKSAFDPVEFVLVGAQAGISQADDQFPSYGQGAAGYGKRYGAAFADQVSSNFFSNFFYPVAFKDDPRYFRLGKGSFKHRFGYSLVQEITCHTDKGGRSFNWPNVLGAMTAGGIANAYYPPSDRGFGLTMSRAGISLFYGSLGGLVDEFYPDIAARLFHKKKPKP